MTLEQALQQVEAWRRDDPRRFDAEAEVRVFGHRRPEPITYTEAHHLDLPKSKGQVSCFRVQCGEWHIDVDWGEIIREGRGAELVEWWTHEYHSDPAADLESLMEVRAEWEQADQQTFCDVLGYLYTRRSCLGDDDDTAMSLWDHLMFTQTGDYTAAALAVLLAKE